MAFLTIAGIGVPVALDGGTKLPPERLGFTGRAYAGNLRTAIRAEKRAWRCTTDLMLNALAASIETAVALGAIVSVSGDFIGTTLNAVVEVGEGPFSNAGSSDGLGFMRSLTLTIREV